MTTTAATVYSVNYFVNGSKLLQMTYGSFKEMSEGVDRVKRMYAYKGEVKESITEL